MSTNIWTHLPSINWFVQRLDRRTHFIISLITYIIIEICKDKGYKLHLRLIYISYFIFHNPI